MSRTYNVLVVDDDHLARWSARTKLSEQNHLVIEEAETAEQALALVDEQPFDLVLLDIGLPGMGGVEALERLIAKHPALKIIMLTAEDRDDVTLGCLARGAFDYLCKPIDLDAIEAAVLRALPSSTTDEPAPPTGAKKDCSHRFIGVSPACELIREQIRRITASRASTILIQGESGTGKEVVARAIHEGSGSKVPFMSVNGTAVPSGLLESELFGHESGAFTDAKHQKKGLFELANKGTLLLDEIGDLDLALQAKLLRVLEDRTFKRVGGTVDICVDLRVIATTNVDLARAVEEGRFRRDLYYRLNVIPVYVPPLHTRSEDIPPLVEHFVRLLNNELETSVKTVSAGAMSLLTRYSWPGNARQLKNVLERIMVVETSEVILVDHLPPEIRNPVEGSVALEGDPRTTAAVKQLPEEGLSLETVERDLIRQALQRSGGNITRAGELVGLHRDTLRYRARKYGLI